ncbi:MAG: hypothetical protein M3280_00870 [Actinomycetota bacterium]|nr:hypothetical protein [Actinomycetota bacterium]
MLSSDNEMRRIASLQFGVLLRHQLIDVGMTEKMIRTRVRNGILSRLYQGVYFINGVPLTWEARLLATQFALGERAAVSHRAAAALFDLDGFSKGVIELTTGNGASLDRNGVIIHRSTLLSSSEIRGAGNYRMTKIERTLGDLGAVVSRDRVEKALESALYLGLTTLPRLADWFARSRRRGLRGVATLASLLEERDPSQAPAESFFETDFYRLLKDSRFWAAEFQFAVFDALGFIGRLDVAYPDKKVGVEAHSLRWHSPRERVKRDAERHNRLTAAGWRVLYETYETLNRRPHEILDRLGSLLDG